MGVTRGFGLLENFLARQRSRLACKLILSSKLSGRVLDLGCGSNPVFLLHAPFQEKYGIDQIFETDDLNLYIEKGIHLYNQNLEIQTRLPFEDAYFDVITMLASVEHIQVVQLPKILKEILRVAKKDGIFILTTPAPYVDHLLHAMAKLKLVSPLEIEDHKATYNHKQLVKLLEESGFSREKIKIGYFEFFMNQWIKAEKTSA